MTRMLLPDAPLVAPRGTATSAETPIATCVAPAGRLTTDGGPLQRRRDAPLLAAYTSAYLSPGMLRVAELLARRDRAHAHVVAVLPPVHDHVPLHAEDLDALRAGRLLLRQRHVRQQVHRAVGRSGRFSTSVLQGNAERTLARLARQHGAGCILVGLDDVGSPGRMESERALLQLARLSTVPVLAVPRGSVSLPRRAIVAVDGTDASVRAARAAASVLSRGSRIVLANVAPGPTESVDDHESGLRRRPRHAGHLVELLAAELRAAAMTVSAISVAGDPAEGVTALAARERADLVACGTSGPSRADWYPMRGMAATLVRRTAHAVVLARSPDSPG